MTMEYYYIQVDPETKKGQLEFRLGQRTEIQPIENFKLIESREIRYHTTEGDIICTDLGPKVISFSMIGAETEPTP